MATLQTLDRGLKALFFVSQAEAGVSVNELAAELSVDRAIAYRIVSTLEAHGLVHRRDGGKIALGVGILTLEARYAAHFRRSVTPLLRKLARETVATTCLSLAEGDDYVAIAVAEPENSILRVSYRVGSRHPLTKGAAGIAILAGRDPKETDSAEVREARDKGYCVTRGALQKGAVGVACPVGSCGADGPLLEGSLGVVAMEDLDVERATLLLLSCADDINRDLASNQ